MSTSGLRPDTEPENTYELGDLELAPRPQPSTPPAPDRRGHAEAPPSDPRSLVAARDASDELALLSFRQPLSVDNDRVRAIGLPTGAADFGSSFDDELHGEALELDLPTEQPPRVVSSTPPTRASSPSLASGAPRGLASGAPADEARRDRELAAYGGPPHGLAAATYALHVARRASVLFRERRALEQRAAALADAYEEALVAFGKALLEDPSVLAHPSLSGQVAAAQALERALLAVHEGVNSARQEDERALEQLANRRAEQEQKLAPYLAEEQRTLLAQQKLAADLKRRRAQLQRVEIELRALDKASLPPPPERLQRGERERTEQQLQLEALTALHAEAELASSRARRDLSARRGELDQVEREHADVSRRSRARHRLLDEQVSTAEHALAQGLCALAEAADSVGLAHAAIAQGAALREREAALDQLIEQIARYDRALPLYDREGLVRGALLWLGLAFLLTIALRLL
jgi:hypothetical protein